MFEAGFGSMAIPLIVACVATATAMRTDIQDFKIRNWLTFPLFISGLLYQSFLSGHGLWWGLAGAALGFLVLVGPYLVGVMGAGDAKLATALGAWLGFRFLFVVLVISFIAMAAYSLYALSRQGRVRDAWFRLQLVGWRMLQLARHMASPNEDDDPDFGAALRAQARTRRDIIPFSVLVGIGLLVAVAVEAKWLPLSIWGRN